MILMNDFKTEPAELRAAMLRAAQRVIESGWYVLGNEVAQFERLWAEKCGVSHGIGVANGMDAIEISLRALNVGPGDEVVTTAMTAFATVLAIHRSGATPVLADIDPDTALLSLESVKRCLGPRTKAIVLVHLYGQLAEMDAWVSFCDSHNIFLVEDCAQAHLASWNGRFAGSFGAMGAFSFYPTKNLGALGDGGMVVTTDDEYAVYASKLRNYGQRQRYYHDHYGLNSRLDEMQAALLMERLRYLDQFTESRRKIALTYAKNIRQNRIEILSTPTQQKSHVYHLFVIKCNERELLQAHLKSHGVDSLSHYPVSIHHQIPCIDLKKDPKGLGYCEEHARTCLSLPIYPQMENSDVETVINAVNSFRID